MADATAAEAVQPVDHGIADGAVQPVDRSIANPPAADFDPLAEDFIRDPYPTWAHLRRNCPVARGARWDFWALTRYEDVKLVSRRPKVFTSAQGVTVPRNPVSGRRAPLHFDPPEHPLYRRPLNAVFSDAHVAELEPRIREVAGELVSGLVDAGGGDAISDLSSPLSAIAFGMFVGIEQDEARSLNDHSERFEYAQGHRQADIAEAENRYLYDQCRALVARRRAQPLDPRRDVLSALMAVRIEGRPLEDEFIAGSLRQLIIAAHVAPTAAIGSAVLHLARDGALQGRLRREPVLLDDAIEELLRMYTPNQGFARTATRRAEVNGCLIEPGEQVALVLTSANRDEQVFPDADRFILGRAPNPHIAFGHGAHKCAGQALARAELRLALEELLSQTAGFALDGDETPLRWPLTGPERLPIRCLPSAARDD